MLIVQPCPLRPFLAGRTINKCQEDCSNTTKYIYRLDDSVLEPEFDISEMRQITGIIYLYICMDIYFNKYKII